MAGIPYKCATSMSNAFSCMSPGVDKTPADWGNLVRGAYSGYTGSYPTLMVFQGASDYTVKDLNMTELVDQWTNVHGLSQTPSSTATFRTSTKKTYGTKVVTYHITGMGHAISVDPGTNADQGGTTGAYSEDKDIYSSYYAAQFWGLIGGTTPPPVEIPVVSISPNGGTFSSAQSVTISATNSPTSIQYSFNNSTWTNYTGAFTVSSSTTVYAKATNSAGTGTKQAAFTINTSTVSVPVVSISPNGGTFSSAQSVTISATNSPTSIQYSFNNSTWTNYSSAISVSSSTTVYAKATNSAGTGTAQATFTINTSTSTTVSFSSISADDGYVKALSTGYSPSVGTYTTMAIGRGSDALYNRAFLSFDTSSIPDGATITRAYVVITYSSISGDPWASSNTMVVDVKNGIFGTYSTTQTTDWAAAATANAVASIAKFTSGTKQSTDFNSSGLSAINKTGKTQLKLRFANDQTSTAYIFIQEGASCKLYVTYN
jgi:hypothetical protein